MLTAKGDATLFSKGGVPFFTGVHPARRLRPSHREAAPERTGAVHRSDSREPTARMGQTVAQARSNLKMALVLMGGSVVPAFGSFLMLSRRGISGAGWDHYGRDPAFPALAPEQTALTRAACGPGEAG